MIMKEGANVKFQDPLTTPEIQDAGQFTGRAHNGIIFAYFADGTKAGLLSPNS